MFPPVFGPTFWDMLHIIAYVYPEEPSEARKSSASQFVTLLGTNLPCGGCGQHCNQYVKATPPDVSSRISFQRWVNDFHNVVNARTGKQTLTFEESTATIKRRFFNINDWMELKRAQEVRREDHLLMSELKLQLSTSQNVTVGLSIAVVVLLGLLCLSRTSTRVP